MYWGCPGTTASLAPKKTVCEFRPDSQWDASGSGNVTDHQFDAGSFAWLWDDLG